MRRLDRLAVFGRVHGKYLAAGNRAVVAAIGQDRGSQPHPADIEAYKIPFEHGRRSSQCSRQGLAHSEPVHRSERLFDICADECRAKFVNPAGATVIDKLEPPVRIHIGDQHWRPIEHRIRHPLTIPGHDGWRCHTWSLGVPLDEQSFEAQPAGEQHRKPENEGRWCRAEAPGDPVIDVNISC